MHSVTAPRVTTVNAPTQRGNFPYHSARRENENVHSPFRIRIALDAVA